MHEFSTSFVVNKRLLNYVIRFEPINERMCYLRVKGDWCNYSFISSHAPTEQMDDDEINAFYDQLEIAVAKIPKQDMSIICGDFNAKIGKEQYLQPTIGKHSLYDVTSDNGV